MTVSAPVRCQCWWLASVGIRLAVGLGIRDGFGLGVGDGVDDIVRLGVGVGADDGVGDGVGAGVRFGARLDFPAGKSKWDTKASGGVALA